MKGKVYLLVLVVFLSALGLQTAQAYTVGSWSRLYEGVETATGYVTSPRQMRAWAFRISLKNPDVSTYVSHDNGGSPGDTTRETTPTFLTSHSMEAAVNGNFFTVISGDYCDVLGTLVSDGTLVSSWDSGGNKRYCCYIYDDQSISVPYVSGNPPSDVNDAVAGDNRPLNGGTLAGDDSTLNPMTGIGHSQDGKYMYMVVIDGRQPGWSDGCTVKDVGRWLDSFGAYSGIAVDGGGSSTIVKASSVNGSAVVLNSPSDGTPRKVASNLGVSSAAAGTIGPGATSWGSDRMDVVERGYMSHIRMKTWTSGGGWQSDWTDLGGTTYYSPAVVSRDVNCIEVFYRGTDNALWHKWTSDGGSTWSGDYSLSGGLTSGPDACSWGSDRIDVILRGGSNNVYWKKWTASAGWAGSYTNLGYPGTGATTAPAIVSRAVNCLEAFVCGSDNKMYHKWSSDGGVTWYAAWSNSGMDANLWYCTPAACSWGSDRMDVVVIGASGTVYWKKWTSAGGWATGWTSLGGSAIGNSEPGIVSKAVNCLEIYYRSSDDHLYHKYTSDAGSTWSGWLDLGCYF